jgi:hypothetical protein
MKKIKFYLLALLIMGVGTVQTSCIGSFGLTNKLFDWNNTIGSKFVNALIFFLFVIIPVYGITLAIDAIVLNTIEFWSGKSPVAMDPGEKETQILADGNKVYKITATQNQWEIEHLEGPDKGKQIFFVFNPDESAWYLKTDEHHIKIMDYVEQENGNDFVEVYQPDGTSAMYDLATRELLAE